MSNIDGNENSAAGDNRGLLWYYQIAPHVQEGPVDNNGIHLLIRNGKIRSDTLVWNVTFGNKWLNVNETELYPLVIKANVPPPPSSIQYTRDAAAWILAISPLISFEYAQDTAWYPVIFIFYWLWIAFWFNIDRKINYSVVELRNFSVWYTVLIGLLPIATIPAYLYERAKCLRSSRVIFFISVLFSLPPTIAVLIWCLTYL